MNEWTDYCSGPFLHQRPLYAVINRHVLASIRDYDITIRLASYWLGSPRNQARRGDTVEVGIGRRCGGIKKRAIGSARDIYHDDDEPCSDPILDAFPQNYSRRRRGKTLHCPAGSRVVAVTKTSRPGWARRPGGSPSAAAAHIDRSRDDTTKPTPNMIDLRRRGRTRNVGLARSRDGRVVLRHNADEDF